MKRLQVIRLLVCLEILSIFMVGAFFFITAPKESKSSQISPPQLSTLQKLAVIKEYWQKAINTGGAANAYTQFKKENARSPLTTQHLYAHVFGELLYRKTGINGIALCDTSYAFGCFHGFFTAAVADKGPAIVLLLNTACNKKFGTYATGCQHGIGHGILEYFGTKKLTDALSLCSKIQIFAVEGCIQGVFMEYNTPIILTENTASFSARAFTMSDPYSPCTQTPKVFQRSCYYILPQWLDKAILLPYGKIGVLCQGIQGTSEQEFCFIGIGNQIAADMDFNPASARDACETMPTTIGATLCHSGLYWAFSTTPPHAKDAAQFCNTLQSFARETCLLKAKLPHETLL